MLALMAGNGAVELEAKLTGFKRQALINGSTGLKSLSPDEEARLRAEIHSADAALYDWVAMIEDARKSMALVRLAITAPPSLKPRPATLPTPPPQSAFAAPPCALSCFSSTERRAEKTMPDITPVDARALAMQAQGALFRLLQETTNETDKQVIRLKIARVGEILEDISFAMGTALANDLNDLSDQLVAATGAVKLDPFGPALRELQAAFDHIGNALGTTARQLKGGIAATPRRIARLQPPAAPNRHRRRQPGRPRLPSAPGQPPPTCCATTMPNCSRAAGRSALSMPARYVRPPSASPPVPPATMRWRPHSAAISVVCHRPHPRHGSKPQLLRPSAQRKSARRPHHRRTDRPSAHRRAHLQLEGQRLRRAADEASGRCP